MSFIQYNSVKIDGDNNLVLQLVDGGNLRIALNEFIDKFTHEKDQRIKELQDALFDKSKVVMLTEERVSTLAAELDRVTKERDSLSVQITKIIEDFSQKDIAASNELYKQAFNLFINAKLDEALALLSEARLQDELLLIQQREEVSKRERRNLADNYLLRAEMLKLKFDFEEASECFKSASLICSEWKYKLEAGNFFKFVNQFDKAELYFNEALSQSDYPEEKAIALNNLAVLQSQANEYNKATENFTQALALYRQLATLNPEMFLKDIATTLQNLANVQSNMQEYEKAEINYKESISLSRQLESTYPGSYLNQLAATLNNYATLQKNRNAYDIAEVNYAEALSIRTKLATENPQTFLPDLATTLNNIGNLNSNRSQHVQAEANYNRALAIRRQLAAENPQTYLPDVAMTLNNLANSQRFRNDYTMAYSGYEEALIIRRHLATVNPKVFLPDVAMTLVNMATLYSYVNIFQNREKALKCSMEAITIALQFSEFMPLCEKYIQISCRVLTHWGEDTEAFLDSIKSK
ncbi:tetratricopeptide repeat protein [Mucilaginibacter pedocola]|uniref:Anaphase-promoting complex subunit 5 domain-containing protein n=1 Tax=Mucilaginibacter pedocola TaxID=1792845 RepID=A0A1S9PC75_9SPHI|nr:tetratricopeptide repeat protein [Mucilaginibacter pedocola]OOQ58539.1 hypothetical protein BC343_07680 [Mucilaginibacter pedocola]